ncbi:MAG: Imidazoleglycerol-phosphate synthase HisH [uncultured bacterium]|nr:MAG: Imidazoleglycerol-phosphate synthase HisH [uncultured bacterium]
MNVVIIDYGMGNIKSLASALSYVGANNIVISSEYQKLKSADKLILPGVGSFAKAINIIRQKKIDIYLNEQVLEKKKPILGICLGMQLMGISSTENGVNKGLGIIDGEVTKFNNNYIKVPHVGFNQVKVNPELKLYQMMVGSLDFYFTHSFRMLSTNNINQCHCYYGDEFIASFENENIAGVQFHPELSQKNGLQLLKNFIEKF